MSHSYSITPAEKKIDRSIMLFLAIIWIGLIAFGFLTVIQPQWLKDISVMGRESEALDLKSQGDEHLRAGQFQAALIKYNLAIETFPEMTAALGNIAIAYAQLGQTKKAEDTMMKVVEKIPERAWVGLLNLGDIYKEKKDFARARAFYLRSLEGNPFPASAYMYLGYCSMELKDWDYALEYYRSALETLTDFEKLYEGSLIRDHYGYRDHKESLDTVNKLLEEGFTDEKKALYDELSFKVMTVQDPNISMIYNDVGIIYYQKNELEMAQTYLKEALRLNPKLHNARNNLRLIARQLNAE